MACYQPNLAVDNGIGEDGKHRIKFVTFLHPEWDLKQFREFYGDRLMMLPCGHCVACAQDYARTWQARIMCEAEYYEKKCFITLTYGSEAPLQPSKAHLREFIKKLRNRYGNNLKFFACGEKGELNKRSHYHIILFGVDFSEDAVIHGRSKEAYIYTSDTLSQLWPFGFSVIGNVDVASAGYVSRYCDKKKISGLDDGEFIIMSRGLGRRYFLDHKKEIFDSDFLYFGGNKFKIPRYFLKVALSLDDFYLRCLVDDLNDRKRLIAQNFRYNSNKSLCLEENAMKDMKDIELNRKAHQEGIRDVGIY